MLQLLCASSCALLRPLHTRPARPVILHHRAAVRCLEDSVAESDDGPSTESGMTMGDVLAAIAGRQQASQPLAMVELEAGLATKLLLGLARRHHHRGIGQQALYETCQNKAKHMPEVLKLLLDANAYLDTHYILL